MTGTQILLLFHFEIGDHTQVCEAWVSSPVVGIPAGGSIGVVTTFFLLVPADQNVEKLATIEPMSA
jgi:hypothetical protein